MPMLHHLLLQETSSFLSNLEKALQWQQTATPRSFVTSQWEGSLLHMTQVLTLQLAHSLAWHRQLHITLSPKYIFDCTQCIVLNRKAHRFWGKLSWREQLTDNRVVRSVNSGNTPELNARLESGLARIKAPLKYWLNKIQQCYSCSIIGRFIKPVLFSNEI